MLNLQVDGSPGAAQAPKCLDEWMRFTAKRKDAANINARKIQVMSVAQSRIEREITYLHLSHAESKFALDAWQGVVHIRAAKLVAGRLAAQRSGSSQSHAAAYQGFNGGDFGKAVCAIHSMLPYSESSHLGCCP